MDVQIKSRDQGEYTRGLLEFWSIVKTTLSDQVGRKCTKFGFVNHSIKQFSITNAVI